MKNVNGGGQEGVRILTRKGGAPEVSVKKELNLRKGRRGRSKDEGNK